MKLLARVERCGGAGSVRAVLAWWVTPVPRQGCAGIVPSGGTHHWARPKHWESSSTTVPALIIHRSSNLLCQKKPWMRWGGWGLEQKLSVSYIFTLSLHPTEMQHKEVREGGIFHLPGTERPCCCSNLWFIPCMNTSFPSHGRAACEPRCDVLVLWPCPLWPPRSGQDTGRTQACCSEWVCQWNSAFHSHVLLSGFSGNHRGALKGQHRDCQGSDPGRAWHAGYAGWWPPNLCSQVSRQVSTSLLFKWQTFTYKLFEPLLPEVKKRKQNSHLSLFCRMKWLATCKWLLR